MTLRARLVVGLAIIAIVLIVPLAIARNAMIELHDQVTDLRDQEVTTSISLGNLRDAVADVRARDVALGVSSGDSVVYRDLLEALRRLERRFDRCTARKLESRPEGTLVDVRQNAARQPQCNGD
jgi:hypothetical protein